MYSDLEMRTSSFSRYIPPALLLMKMKIKIYAYRREFHMVLCCSNLLHHAFKHVEEDVAQTIPWLEWGPDSSRIFVQDPALESPEPSYVMVFMCIFDLTYHTKACLLQVGWLYMR